MTYYHDLITEKSWLELCALRRTYDFILIGGWAVYLYTKALKSRDIDFICDYKELQKLKSHFDLLKNDRLKKYEIHRGEFDIDIYVPYFSDFVIPVEDLQLMKQTREGFYVLNPEALLVLKQKAYEDRAASIKGEKDKLDIITLVNTMENMKKYEALLKKYRLGNYKTALKGLFGSVREAPELGFNEYAIAKLRKKIAA